VKPDGTFRLCLAPGKNYLQFSGGIQTETVSDASFGKDGWKLVEVAEGKTTPVEFKVRLGGSNTGPEADSNPPDDKPSKSSGEPSLNADKTIMARVGAEVITAAEITPPIDRLLAARKTRLSAEEYASKRELLIKKSLEHAIVSKLVFLDAKQRIPAEGMAGIEKSLANLFQKDELPKRLKREGLATAAELDKRLTAQGSSLSQEQRAFCERALVKQWLRKQIKTDGAVTHDEMVKYYDAHRGKFLDAAKTPIPFPDAQQAIRGRIIGERNNRRMTEYLDRLRSTTEVWTIYDGNAALKKDSPAKPSIDKAADSAEEPIGEKKLPEAAVKEREVRLKKKS
jgi:hypothetical protein